MLTQPLLDKLTQLRLSAFRAALEEQLHNSQYADLPFEDRLGLLVDCECTHRDNNRLQRHLKAARLSLPATLEDLDLSPSRGLDRRLVLQLAQGEWICQHLNILVLGPTGVGKTFLACALAHAACRHNFNIRSSVPPACCTRPLSLTPTAPTPNSLTPSPVSNSWSSTTGSEIL